MTAVLNPGLAADVAAVGAFDATACMNCGVCTAVCPLGLDVLPRRLFHDVVLGREDRLSGEIEARLLVPAVPDVRGELPRRGAHHREHPHLARVCQPPPVRDLRRIDMTLPAGDVIALLTDNLRLRGSVVPLPTRRSTRWTRGLGLPRGGPTVALHRSDVPAHALPRAAGHRRAAAGAHLPGSLHGARPAGEQAGQHHRCAGAGRRARNANGTTGSSPTSPRC